MRIGIELDPVELFGTHAREEGRATKLPSKHDDFFFQIQQQTQGDVEEVPAPTRRIQDLDLGDLSGEALQQ